MIGTLVRAVAMAATLSLGAGAIAMAAPPKHGAAPSATARPSWLELTPAQKAALAPLQGEWDALETVRKQKWLEIANRFSSMQAEEQQRMVERMRDWVKLTPAQRKVARENYARVQKIDKDERSAKWEQYQQLPEEQKQKLAAEAARKAGAASVKPGAESPKPANPAMSAPLPPGPAPGNAPPPLTPPAQPAPPVPNAK